MPPAQIFQALWCLLKKYLYEGNKWHRKDEKCFFRNTQSKNLRDTFSQSLSYRLLKTLLAMGWNTTFSLHYEDACSVFLSISKISFSEPNFLIQVHNTIFLNSFMFICTVFYATARESRTRLRPSGTCSLHCIMFLNVSIIVSLSKWSQWSSLRLFLCTSFHHLWKAS